MSPFPVESHRMCLIPPEISYNKKSKMLSTREAYQGIVGTLPNPNSQMPSKGQHCKQPFLIRIGLLCELFSVHMLSYFLFQEAYNIDAIQQIFIQCICQEFRADRGLCVFLLLKAHNDEEHGLWNLNTWILSFTVCKLRILVPTSQSYPKDQKG